MLLTLAVATAACGSDAGTTTETVATTQDVVTEKTNLQDQAEPADPPSGDTAVALVWAESELSGDTYIDQVIVTTDGFIAYRTDEGARAWVSQDGVSWSEADLDFGTANEPELHNVTSGEAGYLALGSTANSQQVLWISEDGLLWESYPVDVEALEGDFEGFDEVVSFDGGLLLRGSFLVRDGDESHSHGIVLAYSEDGVSWEILPDHDTLFGPAAQIGEITSTGFGLIATGYVESEGGGERIWFSLDGKIWDESPADFLNSSDFFYLGPDTVRWGDKVLVVGNSDAGITLYTSVDGSDWDDLPPSPLMESTEDFAVYVQQVAAGPFGIALVVQFEPTQQGPPAITIEKDGVAVTIHFESGTTTVTDVATGALIWESNVDDEDLMRIDDENGNVTIFDPNSGDELTSFTFEELDIAMDKAFEDAGFADPGKTEPEPPVLLFSPDGQRWSSVSTDEIHGSGVSSSVYTSEVIVGADAVIVGFPDIPESEEDYEEEPTDLYGDLPDFIWVGRLGGGQ